MRDRIFSSSFRSANKVASGRDGSWLTPCASSLPATDGGATSQEASTGTAGPSASSA
eukprot:CAMPEP_0113715100 /NCGR_PEP_ID=MMETSP0038_2-20120614/33053_1 /TAXON_ID=2898 /ORGANISM="Cryptomonas paramecium" /LENGTH=56 /DNA_ID=CAMNT_0000642287 /DNA_START=20 /DNA_END=190 /DNA_ORIENTATION=+ /assembly_acc=CAM_ASM_000170